MSVGGTIGVFAGPPASDILGRKKAIILGSLIMLLGVGLQTGAANSKFRNRSAAFSVAFFFV
jgi:MFS family permease